MQSMKDPHKQRKKFLTALINYGNSSGNFNPHFYKKEMMDILMISEVNLILSNTILEINIAIMLVHIMAKIDMQ